jgi:hypothetical protein
MPSVIIGFAESPPSDLEEIKDWWAEQGVPDIGKRFFAEVIDRVEALAHPWGASCPSSARFR